MGFNWQSYNFFFFFFFFLRDFIFKKTLFEKLQYLKQEQYEAISCSVDSIHFMEGVG